MSKTFEAIKDAIARGAIEVSRHALRELEEDGLLLDLVLTAVRRGEVIEDYPTDPRGPSCLVCSALSGDFGCILFGAVIWRAVLPC